MFMFQISVFFFFILIAVVVVTFRCGVLGLVSGWQVVRAE